MAVEKVVEAVIDEIRNAGLVQLEVSARHVHLDKECVEALFGRGYQLTHVRELSQPGQYLEQERVDVVGPKGTFKNVAVLGPERKHVQVEVSFSDAFALGINPPIRQSGDTKGSASVKLVGPKGEITIDELEELGLYEGQGSASIPLYLLPGAKLYFKVKTVGTIDGETKTSELSNWTLIDNVPHEFEYEYDSTDIYNNANYLISVDDNYANGIEVYYAEEDIEDSYQLLTSSETTETMIKIPEGKSYYIKVRTYTIYGDGKEYSDFLPAELLENEYSIILEESFDSYSDETYLYDLYLGFDSYDAYFDYSATIGMELYCSSTKDGEYTKVDDVYDEYDVYVEVPEGEERYCYVKTYEKLDGEKQYGVTTNTVTLRPFSRDALEIDLIDIYDYEDYSGVELTFKNDVVGPFEGIELYTSATVDGTYKAISILEGWYTSGQQFFEVETKDINKFYKVRTFIYEGEEKIYSEYSNAIEFKFDEIELSIMFAGCTSADSCYYGIWAQNANEDTNYTLDGKNMLVYVKTADSNEFELLDDVRGDSYEIASSNIEGNTYKVKMYVGTKENGVYGDWSNEVTKVV